MGDLLSIWRSPLDAVAIEQAHRLADAQPRCDYTVFQAPPLPNPQLPDLVPIAHVSDGKTYAATLQQLAALIGGGGGGGITYTSDLSGLTIYNYGFYGGLQSAASSVNDQAMTNCLAAMNAANPPGGTMWVACGSYSIDALSFNVPDQSQICGSGTTMGGQGLGAITPTFNVVSASGTLFAGSTHGDGGGRYFRNLGFRCTNPSATSNLLIIFPNAAWNTRCYDCVFMDCPQIFNTAGGVGAALSCGLDACTVYYLNGPNGTGPSGFATATFTTPQCFAVGPGEWLQQSQFTGGPRNTNCIALSGQAEHTVLRSLHISHWSYGITYGQTGAGSVRFTNAFDLEMDAWITNVWMQPNQANGTIYGERYTNCRFKLEPNSTVVSSLVYIDTNGGSNSNVDDIQFTSCVWYQSLGHGLEIKTGNNIVVNGGRSSGNGASGGAGVAITGNCGYVTLTGVDLEPKYPNAEVTPPAAQQYALLISGSPQAKVLVTGCPMQNYVGSPVSITGTPNGNIFIFNCAGYNDQNTIVNTLAPGTNNQFAANQGASGGTSYFGPQFMYGLTGGTTIIDITPPIGPAQSLSLAAGEFFSFYISSPYDAIKFTAAPLTFWWLGR